MGFRPNSYATVWETRDNNNGGVSARISISRKNSEGNYDTEFSGFCSFLGKAKDKAKKLLTKDRIKLLETDVTQWYNDKNDTYSYVFKVWDFELANNTSSATTSPTESNPTEGENDLDDADCPF